METQRIASSSPSHGTHATRHRAAQGAPEGLGAFSALLSGLGEVVADAETDASVSKDMSSQSAGSSAGGADPQPAYWDASVLSWTPPPADPGKVGDATEGVDLSTSDELSTSSRQVQLAPAGSAPSTRQGAPFVDSVGSALQLPRAVPPAGTFDLKNEVRPEGLETRRSGSESAGTTAIGKASVESDRPDPGLTKAFGVPANMRAPGAAAGVARNSAETAPSLLVQRGTSMQPMAAGEVLVGAQAVQGSIASVGISHGAAGLVAQTARMDLDAVVGADAEAAGAGDSPAKRALPGRKAAPALSSDKGQRLAQTADLVQRHVAQTEAMGKQVIAKELRLGSEAGQRHQMLQKAEAVRASIGDPVLAPSVAAPPLAMASWVADRRGDTSPSRLEQREFVASSSGQAFGEGGVPLVELPGGASMDGAALSPEDAITEQVTYWLGENLKNAELTVDHAGQPIDVRVSLTGNEAHVAFRSDRAQTRELLDASMDQLRELLHGEGLVLSGMSVDAQAAGQQGESGSDRSPGRERTEEVSVSVGEPLMPTRRILTDRSVDLFV